MSKDWLTTYETTQPWCVWTFGRTHDRWWPLWSSTRITGRARIGQTCAICGEQRVVTLRMPRFGEIPDLGRHPKRLEFLDRHRHPDRGNPYSWAMPLLNPAALGGGIDLDLLAMRLEADINEATE